MARCRAMRALSTLALVLLSAGLVRGTGVPPPWSASYAKARALVANMTLLEMNNLTYGINTGLYDIRPCSGQSGSVDRLGFPGLCFADSGNGVRAQDGVSSFASGIHVGASFNRGLTYARGQYLGAEHRAKGVNVALGPVMGPIGRVAEGGRNWEGFGADPYLAGQLTIESVKGMQESVIACAKHLIAYEQESNRSLSYTLAGGQGVSNNVDDKTLHELYAWPFHDAVEAGVGSVMCSYNRLNQTYACQDDRVLNQILKEEMQFPGFVVSDWDAQQSGLTSAVAGLDVAMPNSPGLWDNGSLAAAVSNGSFSRARLEDMATRQLASWFQFNQDSAPTQAKGLGFGMIGNLSLPHAFVNARDPASAPTILQGAIEGHVLVKNVNHALPLKKTNILSLFGNDAGPPPIDTMDAYSLGSIDVDLFNLNWARLGTSLLDAYIFHTYQPDVINGTLITGGGSGSNTAPYISTPFDAIQQRAIEEGISLFWDYQDLAPQINAASDACLVFLNAYASEGWDRAGLYDDAGDELVQSVASRCNNTMVFIHNSGIRIVDAWIDHPNVTAVMYAHLPGQDAGRALVKLIFGEVSPSGRLPYTVARKENDYGNLLAGCVGSPTDVDPQCNFTEGVNIDYRSFLARNVTPRYEFGYGLTYSDFAYTNLTVHFDSAYASKNSTGLFQDVGMITAQITNIGRYAAAEVPQLYLHIPGAKTKTLRGFDKLYLASNHTAKAEFPLRTKDVSTWDPTTQKWKQTKGVYKVTVGASVLDTRLSGSFQL